MCSSHMVKHLRQKADAHQQLGETSSPKADVYLQRDEHLRQKADAHQRHDEGGKPEARVAHEQHSCGKKSAAVCLVCATPWPMMERRL